MKIWQKLKYLFFYKAQKNFDKAMKFSTINKVANKIDALGPNFTGLFANTDFALDNTPVFTKVLDVVTSTDDIINKINPGLCVLGQVAQILPQLTDKNLFFVKDANGIVQTLFVYKDLNAQWVLCAPTKDQSPVWQAGTTLFSSTLI